MRIRLLPLSARNQANLLFQVVAKRYGARGRIRADLNLTSGVGIRRFAGECLVLTARVLDGR